MIIEEKHIDFDKITSENFEELCFEILLESNFKSVRWLQGGSDRGRDIIAYKVINEPLLNINYEEVWFVECKKYKKTNGVNLKDLSTHLLWAETDSPDHLLIITTSHLTKDAWGWINENRKKKHYKIKVLERKEVNDLILTHQQIAYKYFIKNKYLKLLDNIKQDWLIHNLLPSTDSIYLLSKGVNLETWSTEDLLFLLAVAYAKKDEIEVWMKENEKEMDLDFIYFHICKVENKRNSKGFVLGSGILLDNEPKHLDCFIYEYKSFFLDIHIYAKDYLTVEHTISMDSPITHR